MSSVEIISSIDIKHFVKYSKVIAEIKNASFSRKTKTKSSHWYACDFKSDDCQFEAYNCGICGGYKKTSNLRSYPKSVRKVILCTCKVEEKEESESDEPKKKKEVKVEKVEKPKVKEAVEVKEIENKGITMKKYSEKSFAVYGDTKQYKDELKALGGKFNLNLKEGPGWIFRSTDAPKVSKWLEGNKKSDSDDEEEPKVEKKRLIPTYKKK